MSKKQETAYIVYDTESVVDGALLSRVLYPGESLEPEAAVETYNAELLEKRPGEKPFIPVTFHVPVSIAVARVSADFRLLDLKALAEPEFEPREMVKQFWAGVDFYDRASLVDFNGRGFDIPLLTLSAFRFGITCTRYFHDPDRFGFRYRFTSKHLDLMEWLTEYGAFRLKGGLNLLAKVLGKPGKMGTSGGDVQGLFDAGKVREINDYCLHDVLDTYFVFLRTRVLGGELSLEREQELVDEARTWMEEHVETTPALKEYLEAFGSWVAEPFV